MTKISLRSSGAAFAHDLLMIPLAWLAAYWLRFNLQAIPPAFLADSLSTLLVVMPVQGIVFWYFGLYRGVWRFASIPDLMRIVKAVVVGTLCSVVILFVWTRLEGLPRSVPVLYSVILVGMLGGPRLLYRWIKDHHVYAHRGMRVLIVGAGRAGEMLVRDLRRDPEQAWQPVLLVDDKARRQGQELHGVRVAGSVDQIPALAEEYEIDTIFIAIPSANSREMQRIVGYCGQSGLPVRTLPSYHDISNQTPISQELREVSIEDLLGREPVSLDWVAINRELSGKRILVSGGGGSIGSELCRQVARLGPERLVIFEHSEYNLFEIERELRAVFPQLRLEAVLGDVCDERAVERVLAQFSPQAVFHAAAYKHVPLLQNQVRAAVRNNVLGTKVIAEAADRHACETFVMISTDKAVNPTNYMGASKRVAEIICQTTNCNSSTRYITVRFGNVLGSAGSVVPLFREQIQEGGPVTVTHPEMKRYFMTIPEACELILQAGVMGQGGEIFVLDMGAPISIRYLAEQMIRLSGKEPGKDIEIAFTGVRPGEKLFEELFHEAEGLRPTGNQNILLATSREVDPAQLNEVIGQICEASAEFDEDKLRALVGKLVPELGAKGESLPDSNVVPLTRNP
ncbi:MAG: polysaccharide biosynthesis protein [Pseudomonadota bacterium]|nr:MAG: polysaccharide biosynthesis protein [Pseudomonadota bacterium]